MSLVTFFRISPRSQTLLHSPLLSSAMPRELRVVSFNIKSARYKGRREAEIGRLLRDLQADVVAVQEVLHAGANQTEQIAQQAGLSHWAFAATIKKGRSEYGISLLSRFPLAAVARVDLLHWSAYEPRVALHATLGTGLHVFCVHSDIFPRANLENAKTLAAAVAAVKAEPVIVMGDLNQEPTSAAVATVCAQELIDVLAEHPANTFPSHEPKRRIDYLLVSPTLAPQVRDAHAISTEISDHLPITGLVSLAAAARR